MEFENLLTSWGLPNYIQMFKEEEIDDEAFRCLTEETIRKIFTKGGPYSKFTSRYTNWKLTSTKVFNNDLLSSDIKVLEGDGVYSLESGDFRKVADIDDTEFTRGPQLQSTTVPILVPESDKQSKLLEPVHDCAVIESKEPPHKKAKSSEFPHITEGFIYDALKSNYNGVIAIADYKLNNTLSPCSQQQVTECVLLRELQGDIEKEITAARFKELAKQIKEFFPRECTSTYYIPYFKDELGRKHSASGKLVDLYYNIRKRAAKAGLRQKPEKILHFANESIDDNCDSEDVLKAVSSLSLTAHNWQDYDRKWELTHFYRLKQLQGTGVKKGGKQQYPSESGKVFDYFREYSKGLKQPLGYTLLELDYKLLYPSTEDNLLFFWKTFKGKLISALNSVVKKGTPNFTEGDSDAKILMNFSQLVKPKLISDKQTTKWKPTREVIQDGFMLHVTSANNIETALRELREKAAAHKETTQPLAVVVGENLGNITDSYAVLDDMLYDVGSPVKAVDVTFKIFHAIHAEYPKHAAPLWLILQRAVYGVLTKWDNSKEIVKLESLINKLSCVAE